MDVKDLKIERNRCDCHPETCSCDDWNLVYGGEVLARHLFRERLEKLLDAVIKPVQQERDELLEALERTCRNALELNICSKRDCESCLNSKVIAKVREAL